MTKKMKRNIFRILVVLIMTLCAVYALKFLIITYNYNEISADISSIEEDAAKYGWNSTHGLYYKRNTEKRKKLIENSDIAKFLFYSGYSKTGKITRAVLCMLVFVYLLAYVILSVCYIYYLKKYFSNKYCN